MSELLDPTRRHPLGRTGLTVTRLGLGGAALGNIYTAVAESDADDTVETAWNAGVRYFDTAPLYGSGLSETRMGRALAARPRDEFVLSTKVGWRLDPIAGGRGPQGNFVDAPPLKPVMDFSRAAVERSLEESLERLALDRIDVVYIHDPDEGATNEGAGPYDVSHFDQAMSEAYPVLDALRTEGVIGAIGVGMNQWQMLVDFVQAGDFDCLLLAGRYTLLEQEALDELLPECEQQGIGIVIGGAYNSGILASGAVEGARYNYFPAPAGVLDRVRRIDAACGRHGVPLAAAALQFPLAHPAVATVLPGARSVAEMEQALSLVRHPIPAGLWDDLRTEGLLDPSAPTP